MSIPNEQNESFGGTASFFSDLSDVFEKSQHEFQRSLDWFFGSLKPNLDASRHIDNELNRELAHHFNFLDYLRDDELGLSRIIADLLNPNAKHGQGIKFLEILLQELELKDLVTDFDLMRAIVTIEKTIENDRRIDIYVRIPHRTSAEWYCLAIENKPFADDSEKQVEDYLCHLRSHFGRYVSGGHCLIYLSGDGHPPSNESLGRFERTKLLNKGEFLILSYDGVHFHDAVGEENFEGFRPNVTLVDWLGVCRRACRAEKVRLFLRDVENYCRNRFGGISVASNREIETVEKYLKEHPENVNIALTVFEAWPRIRYSICERFLEQLRENVERRLKNTESGESAGYEVQCMHLGARGTENRLWFCSDSWRVHSGDIANDTGGRTAVMLESYGSMSDWILGVRSPSYEVGQKRVGTQREELEERLTELLGKGTRSDWWPWYRKIDVQYRDWNSRIGDIAKELSVNQGGDMSSYFTREFVELINKTFEVIQEVEGER